MPFLGSQPAEGYRSIAKQTITGNDGTSYSLDYKVTSANDIEVFVNNVRQEPGVAYTASGTTITFSDAISSSDSCYVVFQSRAATSNLIESQNIASGAITSTKLGNNLEFPGDYVKLPSGTTAQRPGSPTQGMIRMNTSTFSPEWYDTSSSSWIAFGAKPPYSTQILVVGGGGGGASAGSRGSGGAGGYIAHPNYTVEGSSVYTVIVGAGGALGALLGNGEYLGANGSDSSFYALTAKGGGGGGASGNAPDRNGRDGGSGGGANYGGTGGLATQSSQAGDSGTYGFGNAGGTGSVDSAAYGGGGGGGAGGAGSNGTSTVGGNGGVGKQWLNDSYYAGGGGGGTYDSGTGGSGGTGGGGTGANGPSGNATAGSANTGGGGGGGSHYGSGASGGSGVVIIRYAGSQRASGGSVTSSGGYTYHVFTSSGTFIA